MSLVSFQSMADEDARKFSGFCSEGQLRISSPLSRLLSLLAQAAPHLARALLEVAHSASSCCCCCTGRPRAPPAGTVARLAYRPLPPCPSSAGLGQAGRGYWMLLLEQAGLCSLASLPSCAFPQVEILHISPYFLVCFRNLHTVLRSGC